MSVDKFRIIEEVRKRPLLWDCQNFVRGRNGKKCTALWDEIAEVVDVNVITCKRTWKRLRVQFCNEANRIPGRIAKAKAKGAYDPNKKYYSWTFFDALRFVANGRSSKARFDLSFKNDSDDSDIEIVEPNNTIEKQVDRNSFQSKSDNDIEIVDFDNLDRVQSEKQKFFDNYYDSDNDIEVIENNNVDLMQRGQGKYFENNFLPKESISTSPIIPMHDSDESKPEDTNFKLYQVSLSSCVQDNECTTISKDNTVLHSDSLVKEEPELQIETEGQPLKTEDITELGDSKSPTVSALELSNSSENLDLYFDSNVNKHQEVAEDHISSSTDANGCGEENGPPDFPDQHIFSLPGTGDEDYSFLYSFLSQTKVMTQLQKMEFRVNMKNLLVHIFPASASVNILEKQLLLPEDSDPDRKFLISFWPFIKSMSLTQNLQFRAKMADLVLQILSSEAIL